MRTAVVTLAEAKNWCRITHDDEDALIATLIEAATDAARDVGDSWQPGEGSYPPARLRLAVLTHVANAYDNRDAADLPASAARLLNPLRRLDV